MDYARIYSEFIDNRKVIQPTGYVERHHIFPRCLGGDDSPENLVDLIPEDHFFAHLLLAKVHGGKLASALRLMADSVERRWKQRLCSRRAYGLGRRIATRQQSEAMQGELNPLFNAAPLDWVNMDSGETRSAVLYDMHREFGGCRAHWTSAATGARNTMKGWRLADRAVRIRGHKGKRFEFINRDGRTFVGTQGEFAAAHGINLATASRVIRHDSVTRCGWRRKGVSDRPHNFAKDGLPARQNRSDPSAT